MGSQEAARELLENTDLKQQRQALIQMKPHRAAALLEVSHRLSIMRAWCQHQLHVAAGYKHLTGMHVTDATCLFLLKTPSPTSTVSACGSLV